MTKCKFNKHSYCIGRKCKYSEPEVGCILNEIDNAGHDYRYEYD